LNGPGLKFSADYSSVQLRRLEKFMADNFIVEEFMAEMSRVKRLGLKRGLKCDF
jgi:hypothetical protein